MDNLSPKLKQMTVIALMTPVLCILSPFSLNIPISPVPISLGSMAVYFVVCVLGMKRGTISVLLYILLGLVGLPVFSNFTGGAGKLFGPTGGYIIGYIFLALIFGGAIDHGTRLIKSELPASILGGLVGTLVLYLFGTVWLAHLLQKDFVTALGLGVIPYIPGDIVKFILAMVIGVQLRKRLKKAGLIS